MKFKQPKHHTSVMFYRVVGGMTAALFATVLFALRSEVARTQNVSQTDTTDTSALLQAQHTTLSSTLTLVFDDGSSVTGTQAESLIQNNDVQTNRVPSEPQLPIVSCRVGNYTFTDRNGTENIRYNCPYHNVNWGFKIAPQLRAIAIGPVSELGARWWKNGRAQSANSPHVAPADYHFHGTFPRVYDNDEISYYDVYVFRVRVGGRTGTARLYTGGAFKVRP